MFGVFGLMLGVVFGILLIVVGMVYIGVLVFGLVWLWGDIIVEFFIGIVIIVLVVFLLVLWVI